MRSEMFTSGTARFMKLQASLSNLSNAGYLESPAILANFSVCNILSFLC